MFANQHLDTLSLDDLANDFCEKFDIPISKQALQERFNEKAVNFLTSLLNKQLKNQLSSLSDGQKNGYSKFKRIRVKDSTRFGLPANYSSTYKGHGGMGGSSQISIQYEYDLISGSPMALQLTSACRNDQQDSKQTLQEIESGDLLLRDLAYVSQNYLSHITEIGAYYLNRLNPKWVVLDKKDKPINFSKIYKQIKKHSLSVKEVECFIRMGKERLKTRLVISAVPSEEYERRIHKAGITAKSKGYKLTDEYKLKAALNLFITNIPKEWLCTKKIRETYSLRWQIELVFKVWKSQARINKMKSMKLHRFQCQLIARFLWLLFHIQALKLLEQWVLKTNPGFKCSQWKFFKIAFRILKQLREVIFNNAPLNNWVIKIYHHPNKKYLSETKKNKISVFDSIDHLLA